MPLRQRRDPRAWVASLSSAGIQSMIQLETSQRSTEVFRLRVRARARVSRQRKARQARSPLSSHSGIVVWLVAENKLRKLAGGPLSLALSSSLSPLSFRSRIELALLSAVHLCELTLNQYHHALRGKSVCLSASPFDSPVSGCSGLRQHVGETVITALRSRI